MIHSAAHRLLLGEMFFGGLHLVVLSYLASFPCTSETCCDAPPGLLDLVRVFVLREGE